jgi:hypothetical protein
MTRKKAQLCPQCEKPAAVLLEWPELEWWPSVLCWPCVQEHIEKDHEAQEETKRQLEASRQQPFKQAIPTKQTIILNSNGTITITFDFNIFKLLKEDREFICGILDWVNHYTQSQAVLASQMEEK